MRWGSMQQCATSRCSTGNSAAKLCREQSTRSAVCPRLHSVQPRQRLQHRTPAVCLSTGPLSPPPQRLGSSSKLVPIFDKIAACVAANDSVHRFETIAGRAAMIGFAVACFAELLLPHGGLFSSFSGTNLELFSSLALLAVAMSAGVATLSKPRIGSQLKEAVLSSLTALKRSKSSLTSLDVDSAVDFVFDSVFSREMLADMLDEHEWI